MILHSVYLSLTHSVDINELSAVMQGLENLVGKIDGFTGFQHGSNIDLEGKSPEVQYGFTCEFSSVFALKTYAADPRHGALGARLVALCDGADQIKVYDIDTGDL